MIAAIAQKTSWSLDKLMFNWFDVALVVMVIFGLWRGRKHGMSKEFLPVSQWVVIVTASSLGYAWVGDWLMHSDQIKSIFGQNITVQSTALMTGYLAIALLVFVFFVALRRKFSPKMEGSAMFGTGEYYFGMIAGVVRYSCMTITLLALLNAPIYTAAEIQARKAFNNRWYGGGMKDFKGDFFPSLDEVQVSVFKTSLTGPFIRDSLSVLLINSAPPAKSKTHTQH